MFLEFIESAKFLASPLSNLVNTLSEGINRIKCKSNIMMRNVKLAEIATVAT